MENDLDELEFEMDALLQHCQKLISENSSLRNKLAKSFHEIATLRNNQQKLLSKIKKIVVQIKGEL